MKRLYGIIFGFVLCFIVALLLFGWPVHVTSSNAVGLYQMETQGLQVQIELSSDSRYQLSVISEEGTTFRAQGRWYANELAGPDYISFEGQIINNVCFYPAKELVVERETEMHLPIWASLFGRFMLFCSDDRSLEKID